MAISENGGAASVPVAPTSHIADLITCRRSLGEAR
jgi:hypothetical protein